MRIVGVVINVVCCTGMHAMRRVVLYWYTFRVQANWHFQGLHSGALRKAPISLSLQRAL